MTTDETVELLPLEVEQARKILSLVLHRLGSTKARAVADSIGIHESTLSKFKSEQLPILCKLLNVLGLTIVPADHTYEDPRYIESLRYLARMHLGGVEPPRR